MKTLQQWLEDQENLCKSPSYNWMGPHTPAGQLGMAVKIIRALVDRATQDDMVYGGEIEEIAERIINEQK